MVEAVIGDLGTFTFDYNTTEHPTPDPGGDPWIFEIEDVVWLCEGKSFGISVNQYALEHKMPNNLTLYECLEQWVYNYEIYDPSDYDYYDD